MKLMDRIIVMKDGRVVETGTHEALLEQGGLYRQMYSMQARKYGVKE